jgi:hypothetical protein
MPGIHEQGTSFHFAAHKLGLTALDQTAVAAIPRPVS